MNRIEELEDTIGELEQEVEELQGERDDRHDEISYGEQEGYERAMLEIEGKIEHAFNAGYEAIKENSDTCLLVALLNYQMEQRL